MVFKQVYSKDTFFLHKALNLIFKIIYHKKVLGVPRHFQLIYI